VTDTADRGYCATCCTDVVIDGPPGDDEGTVWGHLRTETREVVVPGHAPDCMGECRSCPVPVPELERVLVECGPVSLRTAP
jgi:hypothetical protein